MYKREFADVRTLIILFLRGIDLNIEEEEKILYID